MAAAKEDKKIIEPRVSDAGMFSLSQAAQDFAFCIERIQEMKEHYEAVLQDAQRSRLWASPATWPTRDAQINSIKDIINAAVKRIATLKGMQANQPITREDYDQLMLQTELTEYSCIKNYQNFVVASSATPAAK